MLHPLPGFLSGYDVFNVTDIELIRVQTDMLFHAFIGDRKKIFFLQNIFI